MKRLATVSTFTLILVSCASAVSYSDDHKLKNSPETFSQGNPGSSIIQTIINEKSRQTILEKQAAEIAAIKMAEQKIRQEQFDNKADIANRINHLNKYVDKTWYVFSGSTPSGWDCSGLVVWFYEGLGKELPHSASKQGWIKPKVDDPKPGDIVVFRHSGYKNYHHSAIYIGDNNIIHAGFGKGDKTEKISLSNNVFKDTEIAFIRVLDVPLD